MLDIAAFIGIFVATYYAYKTAKDYDRNPFIWSAIVFAVGFGLQVVIPFLLVIIIGVYRVAKGASADNLEQGLTGIATVISLVFMVLSVVGMVLILRYLGTVPDDIPESNDAPPQPPKDFDIN